MKTAQFASRHLGIRTGDLPAMTGRIGVENLEQLIYETLPDGIRLKGPHATGPAHGRT